MFVVFGWVLERSEEIAVTAGAQRTPRSDQSFSNPGFALNSGPEPLCCFYSSINGAVLVVPEYHLE